VWNESIGAMYEKWMNERRTNIDAKEREREREAMKF